MDNFLASLEENCSTESNNCSVVSCFVQSNLFLQDDKGTFGVQQLHGKQIACQSGSCQSTLDYRKVRVKEFYEGIE